jgi:WD40 repeat protein
MVTMRKIASFVPFQLITFGLLFVLTSSFATSSFAASSRAQAAQNGAFIYAAQDDGTIHVYDINNAHHLVKTIRVFTGTADVRGATAAAPTHRFYVMYNQNSHGHVAVVDMLTDKILWDKILHSPGVDRGNITPDGQTLYLPTYEGDTNSPYELAVNAITGTITAKITLPTKSHDTIVSLNGKYVFMETKSVTGTLYIASTATNKVVKTITGYCCSKVLAPFSLNGEDTLVVNDVYGVYGFQIGDVATGKVIATVHFTGTTGDKNNLHGIAWTPNEHEVWANDRGTGSPYVHVFNMTTSTPTQTHLVRLSYDNPHWITFSIDGRFAYVSSAKGSGHPTDIINTSTYSRVGTLTATEDLLEVDFSNGAVTRVGNQFGVGRV